METVQLIFSYCVLPLENTSHTKRYALSPHRSFSAVVSLSSFIVYSRAALLQLFNGGPLSMFSRDAKHSAVHTLFRAGRREEELICQLCPKLKVIRKQGTATSNQMRHLKKFHLYELRRITEKY